MSQLTTRILIVDDHAMVRRGMRLLLEAHMGLSVVAEAGSLLDAVDQAKAYKPDIITLDLSMPGQSGVAAVTRLRQCSPESGIVVVSIHDDAAYVRSALALGARGFVAKSAADGELVSAVREVARGRVYVSAGTDYEHLGDANANGETEGDSPASKLTEREVEVLGAVAQGYSNQQVADRLCLSVKTVESYRARLMQKLGLKDRADLVRLAIGLGLLQGPGDEKPSA